jgi:hypothetical protein
MNPFNVPAPLETLKDTYPTGPDILMVASQIAQQYRKAIVRLWLSEGIPFAFKELPVLYEVFRDALAEHLCVHPKEVTLVGSGRQGASIAGARKCGKPFGEDSDLDWAVVSSLAFSQLGEEFTTWSRDYRDGSVHPRSPWERRCWDNNLNEIPVSLRRGFIDLKRIPWWYRYPAAQGIAAKLWNLDALVRKNTSSPGFTRSTLRAYRDWSSFVRQMTLSLECASRSFASMPENVDGSLRGCDPSCKAVHGCGASHATA